MKIALTCLLAISLCCDGAKIMGIIPTPSYSHQVAYQPLWRELSLRGHQVTVLTTNPMNDPSLVNLTEIDLHFTYEQFGKILQKLDQSYFNGVDLYFEGMVNITESQLKHPQMQKILQDKSQSFDVLLIEFITPIYFSLGERFKCPIIGITSLEAPARAYQLLGSPTHPLLYPEICSLYSGKLNFYERLISTIYAMRISYLYTQYIPIMEVVARKQLGIENLDLERALENVQMLFVNSNPVLSNIRPTTPNVIEVGGGSHFGSIKPLPSETQNFLDNAKEGFIYFSLGSNAKSKDLPKATLDIFLQTFSKLPYRVLWKFEDDKLDGKPSNVMISKWLPQQDVLRHKNIKLFIFQCGWQSSEEALLSKVPVLGIPMLADQTTNARTIVDRGMGLSLDKDSLTEDSLRSTISELIDNPKYRNRVAELSNLMLDQPMAGLEKAIWWTEYMIRHKGAKHLKNLSIDIPWYQYLFLDVIGFCLLVLVGVIFLLLILIKFIFKTINYCFSKFFKLKSD